MSSLKDKVKSASYALGPLGLYHVLVNRARLTVVMFHRVLAHDAPERIGADLDYVIDAELFDQCLGFFGRHYNVVSLDQVVAATRGEHLPGWPLLITFDDGWVDTLTVAAPMLARRNLPAACFVVSDAVGDAGPQWWQNSYNIAWRTQRLTLEGIETAWRQLGLPAPAGPRAGTNPYLLGLAMLAEMPASARLQLLEQSLVGVALNDSRHMLEVDQVASLASAGVGIGAHGATHVPMTLSSNLRDELAGARARLRGYLEAGHRSDEVATLSFPHGRFEDGIVQAGRESGYAVMFTSAPHLTDLPDGQLGTDVCGRIEIATRHVAPGGQFRPDLLACHLFLRAGVKTPEEAIAAGTALLQ
jgi:peptidoglycan/xylan/chitin deacetylase (PgdA/CDA1 family)